MKHLLRFGAVIALCFAVIAFPTFAMAQIAPAPPGSTIDFAPVINPLMQVIGVIIMTLIIPLMWAAIGKLLKAWNIDAEKELAAARLVADRIAQTAIGGAITKYAVKPGQITASVKSEIIAEAAKSLLVNAGESLTKLGVKDNEKIAKAKEMIASRIGLMEATAAGTPVPNPSTETVVAAPAKT